MSAASHHHRQVELTGSVSKPMAVHYDERAGIFAVSCRTDFSLDYVGRRILIKSQPLQKLLARHRLSRPNVVCWRRELAVGRPIVHDAIEQRKTFAFCAFEKYFTAIIRTDGKLRDAEDRSAINLLHHCVDRRSVR